MKWNILVRFLKLEGAHRIIYHYSKAYDHGWSKENETVSRNWVSIFNKRVIYMWNLWFNICVFLFKKISNTDKLKI